MAGNVAGNRQWQCPSSGARLGTSGTRAEKFRLLASSRPLTPSGNSPFPLSFVAMTGITYQTTSEDVASRSLQVTVDPERLEATERRAVREYARKARLPGFRAGHAPEPVVRRRFDAEIRRVVLEESLRESWDAILKESDLKPTADPQIRNVSFEVGKPLTFDMRIEVRPQLALSQTGGFALTRKVPVVTDRRWCASNCSNCASSAAAGARLRACARSPAISSPSL